MTTLVDHTQARPFSSPSVPRQEAGLRAGDRVGSYVVTEVMAQGGCATVYAAEHEILGRRVAIKVLRRELAQDREMVERFYREARAVNLISHPNIVDIHDVGTIPGVGPFLVMERLEGETLDDAVRRLRRFTPREALPILRTVGIALEAAHARGIVHRDLKGSNIFLARTHDDATTVKLLDFGVAKLFGAPGDAKLTTVHRRLGTPSYMAPEQFLGDAIDRRTDVYSLAATVFFMLTGRPPFVAKTLLEVERMHLEHTPPRASEYAPVGAAVDDILRKALAKRPADRPSSVAAFVDAFAAAVEHQDLAPKGDECVAVFATASGDTHEPLASLDFADALEDALRADGYVIALRAGATCLAVRRCGRDELSSTVDRAAMLVLQVATDTGVEPSAFIKRGTAVVSDTSAVGPLLEYGQWAPDTSSRGVHVDDERGYMVRFDGR